MTVFENKSVIMSVLINLLPNTICQFYLKSGIIQI